MKTSTYIYLKTLCIFFLISFSSTAQEEDKNSQMNMDAVFTRPTLGSPDAPVSLGGYLVVQPPRSLD